jgi:hypothetical protein
MSSLLRSVSITLVLAAATACTPGASSSVPPPPESDASAPVPPPSTQATDEFQLRTGMRALWEEHAFYTRNYIIDVVANRPADEIAVTAQRLFQNQIDIGVAVRPFFGASGGDQLTALLHEHIQGAADVLAAAIANDDAAFHAANTAWYQNGYEIAQFLSNANPTWDLATTTNHMNRHLDLTLAEAKARLTGDWAGDVQGYDDVVDHLMTFADFLTQGLVQQFPAIVGPSPLSQKSEGLHLAMRRLWEDHVQWTRVYILDQTANLPSASFSAQRLLRNQSDIGNAIVPFYGQQAGDQLTSLLETHITGAVALISAVESGDDAAIGHAKDAWYANGNDIAIFLANANPNWRLADLELHMKIHLDQTLAEAAAHIAEQWSTDVTAFDAVEAHIRVMADILSDGIAKQFPSRVP